jgi:hypothetical protein
MGQIQISSTGYQYLSIVTMVKSKISINPDIYFVIRITIPTFVSSAKLAYPASRNPDLSDPEEVLMVKRNIQISRTASFLRIVKN